MLKSLNFAVIRCLDCGDTIKIEPNIEFNNVVHECKVVAPRAEAKPAEEPMIIRRRTRKPKGE